MNQQNTVKLIEEEEIVTLHNQDGRKAEFYLAAVIHYNGAAYAAFQPKEKLEDMDEDEVLFFSLEDETSDFSSPVEDDEIWDALLDLYIEELERFAEDGEENQHD